MATALVAVLVPTALILTKLDKPPVISSPVFSLSTLDERGAPNMNLLTYASPVGIRPYRLWAISLYRDTRSHANFAARRTGVLQQLTIAHAPLTYTLGGTSAADAGIDKRAACAEMGFDWGEWPMGDEAAGGRARERHDRPKGSASAWGAEWAGLGGVEKLLPDCLAYLRLSLQGQLIDAGDHDVALCVVEAVYAPPPPPPGAPPLPPALSTADLRRLGLITPQGRAAREARPVGGGEDPQLHAGASMTLDAVATVNGVLVGVPADGMNGVNGAVNRALNGGVNGGLAVESLDELAHLMQYGGPNDFGDPQMM